MNKALKVAAALGAVLLGLASPALGLPFQLGDVLAGGSSGGLGNIYQFRGGVLVDTLNTTHVNEETGMAFDSSGRLYTTNFGSSTMSRFAADSTLLDATFATNDPGAHNESIKFDALGNIYVGQADGSRDILRLNPDGSFNARFDVATGPRGTDWIDLASDGCTMYYASEGTTIRRHDVCANTALADFATGLGGTAFALRILGDGSVLLANGGNIVRVDSGGSIVQTYDQLGVGTWFALNLDPNGTSFWSADIGGSGRITEFNIATGAIENTFLAPSSISGLVVVGELCRVGCGPPPPPGVPEPASLLLTGIGLGLVALVRRRRVS